IGLGDLHGVGEVALSLGRLLLEDVGREGVASAQLALRGHAEALLCAGVRLHLGHRGRLLKQTAGRGTSLRLAPFTGKPTQFVRLQPGTWRVGDPPPAAPRMEGSYD